MDALLAFLGVEVELPPHATEWWATRVHVAANADRARLVAALSERT